MPLTDFQASLARLLAANRSEDSYLAGGAAILAQPNTQRYSQDLDYFHDSEQRVASAFAQDRQTLKDHDYDVNVDLTQPGYIRAVVSKNEQVTKVEWSHDSAWRFMPVMTSESFGYQLHPIDLATNKVLALAGRDEPRDLIDTLYFHQNQLSLGPTVWAAVGKDPGFSPLSLLELLRRRGKVRPEDLTRLHLSEPIEPTTLKSAWLDALDDADAFVRSRRPEQAGCLYYHTINKQFVDPRGHPDDQVQPHFGRPGGVIPQVANG